MISIKKIFQISGLVILIGILGLVGLTTWYTVDESEQAVILTFGRVDSVVTKSGLNFKLPWPIQTVEKLSKETYSLRFGFEEKEDGTIKEFSKEAKMITGDENIVLADLVVQWKISDPEAYLFHSDNPKEILKDATSASLRSIIGSSKIDDALTSGKADIEADVRDLLTRLIEDYDIGISIQAVKLQDVELPNKKVRQAFTDVTDAREMMNTKINEAEKYKNKRTNEAEGEKAAIMANAEGEKTARIQKANGDVAVFNKLYSAYKNNPDITRQRLVLETLEQVLPGAQIYIMKDDGNTLKYFPIRTIEEKQKTEDTSKNYSEQEEGSEKK